MKNLVFVAVLMTLAAGSARAEALVWKTEAELGARAQLPGCDPEKEANCGDSVSYVSRSRHGVNEYLTYFEGVRAQIGFGSKPNNATMVLTGQIHAGAYDWGGVESGGVFKPRVVIKRFYEMTQDGEVAADKSKTQLLLFLLKNDGTSCVLPTIEATENNLMARKRAERTFDKKDCAQ
jgi:hypothetical protein